MAMAMAVPVVRRVATYERVSSEDQRERETIKTQTEQLAISLARQPEIVLVERFVDDGVSGTIPLAERPAGRRLMLAAAAHRIDELHVLKLDRLGRDDIDRLIVRRILKDLGIRLISVLEGEPDDLSYGITSIVDAEMRRQFLRVTAAGMGRAAREGRYTGGIVPLGYRVTGEKQTARLEPDRGVLWADHSAADLVVRIYRALALGDRSCRAIAAELNALGVPTHYARDGRGVRGAATQGQWRAGRIRNLVVNPVYKGSLTYGRRIDQRGPHTEKRGHEIITAQIEPLVAPELWQAAQDTLAANRVIPKNTRRAYLLRGVVRCGTCGLAYCGSQGRDDVGWYRCTGQIVERGPIGGRCPGQSIRTDALEPLVWADIERWLRDPGDILDELDGRAEREAAGSIAVAESATLVRAIEGLEDQRRRAIALGVRGRLTDDELDAELDRITAERTELDRRVAALEPADALEMPSAAIDAIDDLRARLDTGLSDEQRHEIVALLTRIVVHTEGPTEGRRKSARARVEYRFPGVVQFSTVRGSWPRRT